ncbi:pyridoxamine 5'-phosphate oxidase family protein [Dactylosporangium sp. AC04546]|uniref:pyridoxamine 5'-phosphate oxidase family protein n=1 Tax=Dactylosporangium sp. AC04546 TaxID=2862460 RepID=UPI001EDF1E67|nr:pyridoxamine 5'-phosphate oxidase family protein [Dactylosporangium sp. AC04546]WVK82991.1 pyridoxamine 5'-phosphate oxidase family protein [Dactylosporangium sp. AC04546]
MDAPVAGAAERTRVRRLPELAVTDPAVLRAVLDAGVAGHVAFVHDGQPYAIPVAYGRSGDAVLFHGSTGSRLFRTLAAGVPCCFTVTHLDGLVLARSAFETSMQYRSALVLGRCAVVADKVAALRAISEHIVPGRWDVVRPPSTKELAATLVLSLPLDEWSVKVNAGPPDSSAEDDGWDPPTGIVPLQLVRGELP